MGPKRSKCNNSSTWDVDTLFFDLNEVLVILPCAHAKQTYSLEYVDLGRPITRSCLASLEMTP